MLTSYTDYTGNVNRYYIVRTTLNRSCTVASSGSLTVCMILRKVIFFCAEAAWIFKEMTCMCIANSRQ